jgi:hypothetical protein
MRRTISSISPIIKIPDPAEQRKRVATRKRKKRGWLGTLLFYILFPLIVWLVAFLLWFYWRDVSAWLSKGDARVNSPGGVKPRERSDTAPAERPQEKILEEDRRKLDEILKRRG